MVCSSRDAAAQQEGVEWYTWSSALFRTEEQHDVSPSDMKTHFVVVSVMLAARSLRFRQA